jgi:hypothetical protein
MNMVQIQLKSWDSRIPGFQLDLKIVYEFQLWTDFEMFTCCFSCQVVQVIATVRQDPSLLTGPATSPLTKSPCLKVAMASLVLHLLAAIAVAAAIIATPQLIFGVE